MTESNLDRLREIEIALLEAGAYLDCLEPEDELVNEDHFLQSIKQDANNAWNGIKKILEKYPLLDGPEESEEPSPITEKEFEEGIPF